MVTGRLVVLRKFKSSFGVNCAFIKSIVQVMFKVVCFAK